MADRKRVFGIMWTVALCCLVMAFIDGVVKPHYAVKSAIKLVLFSAVPVIYCYLNKEVGIWQVLKTNKRGIGFALLLCLPVFGIILGAYAALKDIFDFSAVTTVLTGDIGVNKGNFAALDITTTITRSNNLEARVMMSKWPLVTGSKLPGQMAIFISQPPLRGRSDTTRYEYGRIDRYAPLQSARCAKAVRHLRQFRIQ